MRCPSENNHTISSQAHSENNEDPCSPKPHVLFHLNVIPVTNAMISAWIVALIMIATTIIFNFCVNRNICQRFTGLIEFAIVSLYEFLVDILGEELVQKSFWFLGSVFFFILFLNWADLLPGVGPIGWGYVTADKGFEVVKPLFRGGNADLNNTLALGAIFFLFWTLISIRQTGIKGFFLHIFGPKGDNKGILKIVMIIVFMAVGVLEVISIIVRPFSLALRLYGNIFAGGVLLETMAKKAPSFAWLVPVPFYFMEALVGFVQALVFALLCAVFIMLSCQHEESEGQEHL